MVFVFLSNFGTMDTFGKLCIRESPCALKPGTPLLVFIGAMGLDTCGIFLLCTECPAFEAMVVLFELDKTLAIMY